MTNHHLEPHVHDPDGPQPGQPITLHLSTTHPNFERDLSIRSLKLASHGAYNRKQYLLHQAFYPALSLRECRILSSHRGYMYRHMLCRIQSHSLVVILRSHLHLMMISCFFSILIQIFPFLFQLTHPGFAANGLPRINNQGLLCDPYLGKAPIHECMTTLEEFDFIRRIRGYDAEQQIEFTDFTTIPQGLHPHEVLHPNIYPFYHFHIGPQRTFLSLLLYIREM